MQTKQHLLSRLLPVIHKANPELMKLEFGCEMKGKKSKDDYVLISKSDYATSRLHSAFNLTKNFGVDIEVNDFEILGKPPTLEHVLKAIGETNFKNLPLNPTETFNLVWQKWQLGLPLDQQPLPVLTFLVSLLCGEGE